MRFRFNPCVHLRWLILALLGVLGALIPSPAEAAELQAVKFEEPVRKIYLAGDDKYLVGVLWNRRIVVILDAEKFEEIARFEVPGAGPIFSRSGQLYISNEASGLIQVYSEKNWELVNEIDTGVRNLKVISSRRGDQFGGKILVSSYKKVNLVDVEKDTFITLREGAGDANFSVDGEKVTDTKDGKFRAFSTSDYLSGSDAKPLRIIDRGNIGDFPVPIADGFWLQGANDLCVGIPPYFKTKPTGSSIIPDSDPTTNIVYTMSPDGQSIEVRRLDDAFSLVQTVDVSKLTTISMGRLYHGTNRTRRNDDGSVTLFWIGSRLDGIKALRFAYSEPLRAGLVGKQRVSLPEADTNVLVSGPDGSELTEGGDLVWKPDPGVASGSYTFKVKQTREGKISFFRKTLKVLPAEDQIVPEGLTKLSGLPERQQATAVSDTGYERFVLVDETRLLVFGNDGAPTKTLSLEKKYRSVVCLKNGYALGLGHKIDLCDLNGEIERTIDLGAVEVLNMSLDLSGEIAFVACKDPTIKELAKSLPVYKLDLSSGKFERMPRMVGGDVRVNPSGDQLVSFISHSQIHWVGISNYYEETADLLMSHQLDGRSARLHRASVDPVQGISDLTFSADGTSIAVKARKVPSRGQLMHGYLPIFAASDLEKPKRLIALDGRSVSAVKYHPRLDLLFVVTSVQRSGQVTVSIVGLDGEGVSRPNLIAGEVQVPGMADFIAIAPNGESLLVRGRDIYGRRVLQRMPLLLTEAEQKKNKEKRSVLPVFGGSPATGVGQGRSPLDGAGSAIARGLSPSSMKALSQNSRDMKEMDPRIMARFKMPAVVIVNGGENGIGAGFFVSNDGHIVTAAHCLPDLGGPEVFHYVDMPFERMEFSTQATVIDIDEERDLALIKIDCNANSPWLSLSVADPKVGAKAFAIGHPGVNNLSLDYTLTSGLVSSAARELKGQKLLQISAPVNPGNSGGPVLDDRGNVVGMVSQKAALEGASFAVPASLIAEFLRRSKSEIDPERPGSEEVDKKIQAKGWLSIEKLTFKGEPMRAALKGTEEKWFTGTLAILGNPMNHILVTVEYQNGFPHGDCIQYNRAGRKLKTTQYQEGVKSGLMTTWYPSGNPQLEISLRNGESNGFSREFDDRKYGVREAACFKDGVLHGFSYRMDELGRVFLSTFYKEGKAVQQSERNHYDRIEGVPIFEFTKVGDTVMVERLVKSGISIDTKGKQGSVLHVAVAKGFHYLVRAVLKLGADPNIKNEGGLTPLAMLMLKDEPDLTLAKILVEGGASKEELSKDKQDLLK